MRALIVDDSSAMRRILARFVKPCGFDVHEAADGRQALDVIAEVGPVDLALVDWNMPEMNGYEFLVAARADAGNAATRIVMVTTETEIDRIVAALDAGADEYVMKPFTADVIRGKLEQLGLVGAAG